LPYESSEDDPVNEDSVLDQIGIECATDKSSLGGGYLEFYGEIFSRIRNEIFNMIEVGVFNGSSVRMWEKFFPNATVVGIDIDPGCSRFAAERIKIRIGSQNEPDFLHGVVSEFPARIIIDDGSHRSDHIAFTFERLFPALLPGGWYIVEDLHFHGIPQTRDRLRGSAEKYATDYFLDIARDRVKGEQLTREYEGMRRYLVGSISDMSFISGAVVIRKKKPKRDVRSLLEFVEKSNDWLNWFNYASQLKSQRAPVEEVLSSLRQSVNADSTRLIVYERLSDNLYEIGRVSESVSVLEEGLRLASMNETQRQLIIKVIADRGCKVDPK
jgi:hypothetical protein